MLKKTSLLEELSQGATTKAAPKRKLKCVDWKAIDFNEVKTTGKLSGKSKQIGNYDAKPELRFLGKSAWKDYLGVELEVECQDGMEGHRNHLIFDTDAILNKTEYGDFCILKHDGSLKGHGAGGFEICTTPATLDVHKDVWQKYLDNLPNGVSMSNRCGMHVHVSKENLTPLQIGKIIAFVHKKSNATFIKLVSGRGSCHYANYNDPKSEKYSLPKYQNTFEHYSAVNILNPNTVEFRIFVGTLNYADFCKNLEFCHALVKFCFPGQTSLSLSADLNTFIKFINDHRKTYPFLATFLHKKGQKGIKSLHRFSETSNIY